MELLKSLLPQHTSFKDQGDRVSLGSKARKLLIVGSDAVATAGGSGSGASYFRKCFVAWKAMALGEREGLSTFDQHALRIKSCRDMSAMVDAYKTKTSLPRKGGSYLYCFLWHRYMLRIRGAFSFWKSSFGIVRRVKYKFFARWSLRTSQIILNKMKIQKLIAQTAPLVRNVKRGWKLLAVAKWRQFVVHHKQMQKVARWFTVWKTTSFACKQWRLARLKVALKEWLALAKEEKEKRRVLLPLERLLKKWIRYFQRRKRLEEEEFAQIEADMSLLGPSSASSSSSSSSSSSPASPSYNSSKNHSKVFSSPDSVRQGRGRGRESKHTSSVVKKPGGGPRTPSRQIATGPMSPHTPMLHQPRRVRTPLSAISSGGQPRRGESTGNRTSEEAYEREKFLWRLESAKKEIQAFEERIGNMKMR